AAGLDGDVPLRLVHQLRRVLRGLRRPDGAGGPRRAGRVHAPGPRPGAVTRPARQCSERGRLAGAKSPVSSVGRGGHRVERSRPEADMPRVVRGALIQATLCEPATSPVAKIKEAMLEKHVALIAQAAGRGAQVVCLQELCTGPYFCAEQQTRWYDLTERIP